MSILNTLPITIPLKPSNFILNLRGIMLEISDFLVVFNVPSFKSYWDNSIFVVFINFKAVLAEERTPEGISL